MLEAAVAQVASALRVPPNRVRWETDVPGVGWGLVVHTPWARVLVARTSSQASRFSEAYTEQANRAAGMALLGALLEQYPHLVVDWTDVRGLGETPLPDMDLRRFISWAVPKADTIGWPVAPSVQVLGAWATYPDAILLVRPNPRGEREYQLRLAAWKDYNPGP